MDSTTRVPEEGSVSREVTASALAHDRTARTVGDFGRMLAGAFRRHDPQDADRAPLVRAARLAAAHLGLKPSETTQADGETDEVFVRRFAAGSGACVRPVNVEDLGSLEGEGPIIAWDVAGNPVTVLPARLRGIEVVDPVTMAAAATPLRRIGYALHAVLPAGKLTYRSLMAFGLRPCVPALVALLACGIIEGFLGLAPPVAFGFVANTIIPTDNVSLLWVVSATLLVALLVQTAVHLTAQFARAQIDGRSSLALHAAMVDRVLRLPASVLRQSSTAILATQTETVDKFRRSILDYAINLVLAALHGLLAAGLLCFYSPAAGAVAIASVVLLMALAGLFGRLQYQAIYEGERMDVVVLTFVYDLIRLVPVLQAHRAERQAFVQWAQNFLAFQSRIVRSSRIGNVLLAIQSGWEVATLALSFIAVAYVGVGAAFATASAIAFVVGLGRLNAAGLRASHALIGIAKAMPMAKLARSLIEQPVPPLASGAAVERVRGRVTFSRASFGYDTRTVLDQVSLDIEAGEFVGITGPSGGGKSTLVRLLLGLDMPQSGAVLVDGIDIRAFDAAGLSRQIGVVLQDSQVWAGTIFENIRGASTISLAEAEALAERVGLSAELATMPMGLQTIVAEGGLGLSSGQAQRILIARALATGPRILVLDEPAGALRGKQQAALVEMLAGLDMTRIVLSHDRDLLARSSRLFRLAGGHLAEVPASDMPDQGP